MARDYTKYTVEGLGENLNKRQLVFTIVKDWATKNKPSLEEIQTAFPDEVQGGKGFIAKESEVKDAKRFNMEEPLSIKNSTKVVVSNQWGAKNIEPFLELVKGLGYDVKKIAKEVATEKPAASTADASFDITQLSIRDFKKLLRNIEDKEAFEKSLIKQVKFNIDFWSYLLIYDNVVNDGGLELSMNNSDEADDIFLVEWYEFEDEQMSLAQFVLEKLDINFEEVNTDKEKKIQYIAAFGSYLYYSLSNLSYEIGAPEMAGFIASNDHTSIQDGEDVFSEHGIGDDWIISMADEWLMYCGFDSSDYEGECGVFLMNGDFMEFSINYEGMAEDIIAQFE